MNYLLTLLVITANILGAGMIVPQVLRLRRDRTTEGVSAVGAGVGIALNLWWFIYGLQAEGAIGIVPVSIAGVMLYSTIALQLTKLDGRGQLSPIFGGFVGFGFIPLLPYLFIDLRTTGIALGLLYTVQFTPAALAVIRTTEPVGVSASTWTMGLAEALIWFIYGVIIGDPALTIGGAGGSFFSFVILVRLFLVMRPLQDQKRRRRLAL